MELKKKTKIMVCIYIVYMIYFMLGFMPTFTEAVSGNEMVDAYLVDYSKTIFDIEQLILQYGESGRSFMVNFFIADSVYVVISCVTFSFLIACVTQKKILRWIPLFTGICDTIENILVLYSVQTLNMGFLPLARFFATVKACSLFLSFLIILVGWLRCKKMKRA